MDEKSKTAFGHFISFFLLGAILVLVASLSTLYAAKRLFRHQICHSRPTANDLHFGDLVQWDSVRNIQMPGKDVTVSRTTDKCFISPTQPKGNKEKPEPLRLVPEPLTDGMIDAIGGPAAVEVCKGVPTYLLKVALPNSPALHRFRRQSGRGRRYDESVNQNRCSDVVIVCDNQIGQTKTCNTAVNGFLKMDQTCKQGKQGGSEITIAMVKPTGRLLVVLREQAQICAARRRQGKRC